MSVKPLSYARFRALLPNSFQSTTAKAIALSGGSDSIALAALLREQLDCSKNLYTFTVDHGLRPESATDARSIHDDFTRMGLHHEILRIAPLPTTGIEKHARIARYTALTQACLKHGITELYLGHHADDQVENLLLRLMQGSGWRGMAGMQVIASNPLSKTMFDAHKVKLFRPLLGVSKARLRATCLDRKLKCYEDMSNHNLALTPRNAVRHALRKSELFPKALQPNSLLEFSRAMLRIAKDEMDQVKRLFRATRPSICRVTGTITFQVAAMFAADLPRNVLLSLLELIGQIITPVATMDRKVLDVVLDNLYAQANAKEDSHKQSSAAGLLWKFCRGACVVRRQPFIRGEAPIPIVLGYADCRTQWLSWDRRFWLRVHQPLPFNVVIRELREADMAELATLGKEESMGDTIGHFLKAAKGPVRFTLPVVVNGTSGQILALPSAGLSFCNEIAVECQLVGEHIWQNSFLE